MGAHNPNNTLPMRTETEEVAWCELQIRNDAGEKLTELDCPSPVKERIYKALRRGDQQGIIASGGQL
jgi:hypothetical protein